MSSAVICTCQKSGTIFLFHVPGPAGVGVYAGVGVAKEYPFARRSSMRFCLADMSFCRSIR